MVPFGQLFMFYVSEPGQKVSVGVGGTWCEKRGSLQVCE